MIDQVRLTEDLRRLMDKELLPALRKRAEREKALDAALREEHAAAKAARRTGQAFEMWREDMLTQVGVAWVLGCVFVRFMEDNGLVDAKDHFPRIAGAGANKKYAEDQRTDYFRRHGTQTDRDYLLWAFTDLAKLPACKELFSKAHNPLWAQDGKLMDADAATRLIEFFQQVDGKAEGKLLYDFQDESLSTRFLGDLYQNLSEAARKKYALLQTPVFVEEFILDRTLEPAIKEFGLCDQKGRDLSAQKKPIPSDHLLRMIDPTVGSGHFLLGGFERLFARWQKQEPMTEPAVLAERCLNSLFGVDLNPYAANIARFRLLVAALKACGIKRLREARDWTINIAVGDSLLHGSFVGSVKTGELFEAQVRTDTGNEYATSAEDLEVLRRFLLPRRYHVVVGNPPYITVKDAALSEAYRRRYGSCHRKYALSVPFFERFFDLAVAPESAEVSKAGFVGKITANSFMKREFGKKLIETYLPRWDLTHVIDTSLAYIPEHGTPTVTLFGRHRTPVSTTMRLVGAIKREDGEPDPPESGKVWSAIVDQIDRPGSVSEFVSVTDTVRDTFHKHPWSIGGGGAAELKETIDEAGHSSLADFVISIGFGAILGEDDAFGVPPQSPPARSIPYGQSRPLIEGDLVRDWRLDSEIVVLFPYDGNISLVSEAKVERWLWANRTPLASRLDFSKKTYSKCGRAWWEYHQIPRDRNMNPFSITFAFVGTHNHFVFDRGGKVFKQSAPVIKLPLGSSEGDYLALVGLLNSASGQFWMKQVFHDKGGGGIGGGIAAESWERFLEYDSTKIKQCPVPWEGGAEGTENPLRTAVMAVARNIDTLAQARAQLLPTSLLAAAPGTQSARLQAARTVLQLAGRHLPSSRMPRQPDRQHLQANGSALQTDGSILQLARTSLQPNRREADAHPSAESPRAAGQSSPAAPPSAVLSRADLDDARDAAATIRQQMIALQEELDWLVYRAYGLLEDTKAEYQPATEAPPINLGERAFEIVMARKMEAGTLSTEWFRRHGSTPITQVPAHWPAAYKKVVEHRIALIEAGSKQNKDIALIEQPEYKRRWNTEKWEEMEERALGEWLLDRLEWGTKTPNAQAAPGEASRSTIWNEAEPQVMTAGRLADLVRTDTAFMQVAALYRGRTDFDVSDLVAELVAEESVPFLPSLRYKESGLTKRRVWERTWELQREEDRLEALRVPARAKVEAAKEAVLASLPTKEADEARKHPEVLARILKKDAAWNAAVAKLDAVPANPEIDVPPRYTSADFLPGPAWRLRGKLDVPKERFVSLPHCGPDADPTMLIMWAGFDHRQQALAIATYYQDRKDNAGWDKARFVPLLAGLLELLPWVKKWHGEPDASGTEWGPYFESFVNDEARWLGLTLDQIRAWQPPAKTKGRKGKSKAALFAGGEADGEND